MSNQARPRAAIERHAGAEYRQHFQLDDEGRIMEHWDVLQIIPEYSANDNGMF